MNGSVGNYAVLHINMYSNKSKQMLIKLFLEKQVSHIDNISWKLKYSYHIIN